MITIQDKILTVQKPFNFNYQFYTLILQNTITKEITQFTMSDIDSNSMYIHFNVDNLNLINGEYFLLLLSNNNREEINIVTAEIFNENFNKPLDINNEEFYYLVYDGLYISNGDIYLGINKVNNTGGNTEAVQILTKELLKFGDYNAKIKEYNNTKKYITYNG